MHMSLDDRYDLTEGTLYLTGIQALVRMVRDNATDDRNRGHRTGSFVSGYEGSPLAGYDLELMRRRNIFDGLDHAHEPGVNEELAATSVMGSQLADQVGTMTCDGIVGYWYGKSPGLDRASDALRHANLVGTHPLGGAVALVGDDPAGKSSSLAGASEYALADLQIPTLYPADPQEILDLGIHAVQMSRHSGLWSAMKIVTAVADGASTATVRGTRFDPTAGLEPSTHRPDAFLAGPNLLQLERSLVSQRLPRVLDYARANGLNRQLGGTVNDRIGIVTAGKTWLDVRDALHRLGLDEHERQRCGIRCLKLDLIWPLDRDLIAEFADGLDELIVVEEKRPFIEDGVRNALYGLHDGPKVIGKLDDAGRELVSPIGELDTDQVTRALVRRLADAHRLPTALAWKEQQPPSRTALPLLTRTPYFCSGCPHNTSTKLPDDSTVGGGIGCHAMVLFMDDQQTGKVAGLTQMGGEGAQWLGIAPFVREDHFFQNIGDGTFTHSGSLALRAAVTAGRNVTYKLLYNATVAMTGGQDPAGGFTLHRLVQLLIAEGVAKVVVTSEDPRQTRRSVPRGVEVRGRDDIVEVQERLARISGVTVLVHDQECAAELRRKRKRGKAETPNTRVVINERICEGCGDCGEKSNCMSVHPVETEYGRKTQIHQSSCNLDYSCLKGDCPSFVTVQVGERKPRRVHVGDIGADAIPPPVETVTAADYGLRITGIGGTGVVTVSQIIATAAVIDGHQVRSLDQTGLAQKGGAVVSDVRITGRGVPGKVPANDCDLYLVCDGLVGTDPTHLKAADPRRTAVVASTAEVPTGQMVVDTSTHYPGSSAIRDSLEAVAQRYVAIDVSQLAEQLFGHEQYANMLLVGAAWQLGRLPVSAAALEHAITLNDAASATNIQAFRRGRQVAHDPAAIKALLSPGPVAPPRPTPETIALASTVASPPDSELERLVADRVQDLVAYQDADYARDYAFFVEQVRDAEESAVPGSSALSEEVARYLYKLMAYKDEYEVARLVLEAGLDDTVADQFGDDARYRVKLHPPALRAFGLKRKIGLGRKARPVFRALRWARRTRGTTFDVFGHHPIRKLERELIVEYRDAIEGALVGLDTETIGPAIKMAGLPDQVRGYEQIKRDNVAKYRNDLNAVRAELVQVAALRQPGTPTSE